MSGAQKTRFVGGKGADGVWQRIVNLIPPHRLFIEPFAGEGVIARKLRSGAKKILVDHVRQPGLVLPRGARFFQGDGISFIEGFDYGARPEHVVIYGDPPYYLPTRKGVAYYEHELSDQEHERLLRVVVALAKRGVRVLLSGYPSALYDRALRGWGKEEFQATTRGGRVATEVIWFSFPRPAVLHDYQCVGAEYRARRRLRKKIARAAADLLRMPPTERGAMLCAMLGAMPAAERAAALACATGAAPGVAAPAGSAGIDAPSSGDPRAGTDAPPWAGAAAARAGNGVAGPQVLRAISGATAGEVAPKLFAAFAAAMAQQKKGVFQASAISAGTVEGGAYSVRVEVRSERRVMLPAVPPDRGD